MKHVTALSLLLLLLAGCASRQRCCCGPRADDKVYIEEVKSRWQDVCFPEK